MHLEKELPVSLQLIAYTILLIIMTESITELYTVHTGGNLSFSGRKAGCVHRDHDEEEARDMNKTRKVTGLQ